VSKSADVINASGVVPWRRRGEGVEILLVHRPRYDDWSMPKGKRDEGETDETCAIREMHEETGYLGTLGAELPTALYEHRGRPKEVCYWLMEVTDFGDAFEPNEEVDEIGWFELGVARARLSYELDQALLDEAALVLVASGVAVGGGER
jgi:8-oxo-dGTP diphosphatase